MRAFVIAWVLGSTLAAQAGLGGRWAGSISADGGPAHPLYARFERDGGAVTGAIGSDSTRLAAIANARVSGDTIRFDARWGDVVHITLVRRGDRLDGELHGDGPPPPPGKHPAVITIGLRRVGRAE